MPTATSVSAADYHNPERAAADAAGLRPFCGGVRVPTI
ncbi:MAG: hypothetical protein JG765_2619 [Cereibacter sp.]|jgi:hypothetical protein|nr:hypothetical protein [Cereibacter sp.]